MKKTLFLIAVSVLALSGCGEKKHEDGHTDADHAAIAAKEGAGGDEHAGMEMGGASHHHGAATLKVALSTG